MASSYGAGPAFFPDKFRARYQGASLETSTRLLGVPLGLEQDSSPGRTSTSLAHTSSAGLRALANPRRLAIVPGASGEIAVGCERSSIQVG